MKTVKLGPFNGGINNVAPDHTLPKDDRRGIHYLRDAVNVDVTNTGTLRRRAGFAKQYAGADVTSAWSDGKSAYVVDAGVLKTLTPDANGGLLETTVTNTDGANLARGAAFVKTPLGLVLSDGFNLYRVKDGALKLMTLDPPSFVAEASSSLAPQDFLVTVTRTVDGVESAPAMLQHLTGAYPITVEIPASAVGATTLYVSPANGASVYRYGTLVATSTTLFGDVALKDAPLTLGLQNMVAGSRLYMAFGRLWSVQGNTVFYSDPYRFALRTPTNFVMLPDSVSVFHPVNTGFVVATTSEIGFVFSGNPGEFAYRTLLPYGAVFGTDVVDFDNGVFLMTARGLVKVSQDGQAENIHEGKVAVDRATSGASGIVDRDGHASVVTSLFRPELSRTAASSFMDAEIIRKETYL
jgi:hypothetical protein